MKKNRHRSRALPLTITLGSILIVFTLVLTTLWNIVLVYNSLQLKQYAGVTGIWKQWVILGIGSFFFVVIIVGITLFIIFMSRQILLNQMQKNFIDGVTHELKTPLTSLRLYVETLQRHKLEGAKREQFLNTMLQDLEYLDALVNHVLEAARIEYRRSQDHFKAVQLHPVLDDCRQLILRRYMLNATCITLESNCELNLYTDPHALHLVFVNLLDNAVKYSCETPEVRVRCHTQGEQVEITVSDQGMGIPENEQRRIFRRFYRGSMVDQAKGSGLGLFIVREAIKQMRGQIQVQSDGRDQGTRFTVRLPLKTPMR